MSSWLKGRSTAGYVGLGLGCAGVVGVVGTALWHVLHFRALGKALEDRLVNVDGGEAKAKTIIVLFNNSSGSQQAKAIAEAIQTRAGPTVEVLPLSNDSLSTVTSRLSASPSSSSSTRLIVCGGDGSVNWVLSALSKAGLVSSVPVGIIPTGSGNDLAQSLGWGRKATAIPGCPKGKFWKTDAGVSAWLKRVQASDTLSTDVWKVTLKANPSRGKLQWLKGGKPEDVRGTSMEVHMVNYMSIGHDAKLVWDVESFRAGSRWMTRLLYCLVGLKITALLPIPISIPMTTLQVDGEVLPFETGYGPMVGIMLLNIGAYGGGCPLWSLGKLHNQMGHEFSNLRTLPDADTAMDDGKFDMMAARTMFQLGTAVSSHTKTLGGLSKFSQGSDMRMEWATPSHIDYSMYVQVDGEAFKIRNPHTFTTTRAHTACLLRNADTHDLYNP